MKIFISGGSNSGKSEYAQKLAYYQNDYGNPIYYITTLAPKDSDDIYMIKKRKSKRRKLRLTTFECETNIKDVLKSINIRYMVIIDSITNLLENEMFLNNGSIKFNAYDKVVDELKDVFLNVNNIIIISDNIYNDAAIHAKHTETFKRNLSKIDIYLAEFCDVVIEYSNGFEIVHKTCDQFKELQNKIIKFGG